MADQWDRRGGILNKELQVRDRRFGVWSLKPLALGDEEFHRVDTGNGIVGQIRSGRSPCYCGGFVEHLLHLRGESDLGRVIGGYVLGFHGGFENSSTCVNL